MLLKIKNNLLEERDFLHKLYIHYKRHVKDIPVDKCPLCKTLLKAKSPYPQPLSFSKTLLEYIAQVANASEHSGIFF